MSSKLKNSFYRVIEGIGRARVRRHLLNYSNRELADMGFSRRLLEVGTSTWPWREAPPEAAPGVAPVSATEQRRAVAELQAYSDAELNDLGLNRAGIEDAVRHGRPVDGERERRLAA